MDKFAPRTNAPGIDYHVRNDFHVLRIDLQSANLSFEMVMAHDVTSVNFGKPSASPREYVRDMVARAPYVNRNPVMAFNADYFGDDEKGNTEHGPEGLTVKNGVRFDGLYAYPPEVDRDQAEWKRSSLSISASNTVRIGKLTACQGDKCFDWLPTADYYNTVGGGPVFIDKGVRVGGKGSIKPCKNEKSGKLALWYCTASFNWTAAGITRDGCSLIVVVSGEPKTMDQAAAVLIVEGAWKAIKLDGGNSSQVWYRYANPRDLVKGERPVANAMMVFSST